MPLIIDCKGYTYYDGQLIPNKPSRYTAEEQLQILETHPFFTGICPQCRHKFDRSNPTTVWNCPNCDWIDDSV